MKGSELEGVSREKLLGMYRSMLRIRYFEEKVYFLFLQGTMPGTIHQYQGQEATAVGICSALREDDFITSTHRPLATAWQSGWLRRSLVAAGVKGAPCTWQIWVKG